MRPVQRMLSLSVALGLVMASSAAQATVSVDLFQWKYRDVAKECETVLAPKGATVCTYINVETNGALATNLAAWMKTAVIHAAWLLDQVCVPSCNLSILPVLL